MLEEPVKGIATRIFMFSIIDGRGVMTRMNYTKRCDISKEYLVNGIFNKEY